MTLRPGESVIEKETSSSELIVTDAQPMATWVAQLIVALGFPVFSPTEQTEWRPKLV